MRFVLALSVLLLGAGESFAQERLTVVSWGGAYADSQEKAMMRPFADKTGVVVARRDYDGEVEALRAAALSDSSDWDVVDVEKATAILGCEEGWFQPIDLDALPVGADGAAPRDDFVDGALQRCGVGSVVWSTVVAYRGDAEVGAPEALPDFFDLARFPGPRGLRRTPVGNLELALMADGVAAREVYAALATEEGVERAFSKLDSLGVDVRWWRDGAEPVRWLQEGEVAMTTAYNGRVFAEGAPLDILWDGQLLQYDLFAIMANAPNPDRAREFVAFATAAERLARQAEMIAYGPARRSAYNLVSTEVLDHLPTAPQNFRGALMTDNVFWAANVDRLTARFEAWLADRAPSR